MLPDFRVRQRDYLLEISRALTQELDPDKLLERILAISLEVLAGQAGLIALRDMESGWQVRVSTGLPPAFLRYLEPQFAELSNDQSPDDVDIQVINRVLDTFSRAVSLGRLRSVGLPLIISQRVVGVIFVFREHAEFSSNDRALLSSFADQAAIAVRNAQLYTEVEHDRRRIAGLLDAAGDGILILNSELKIERVNQSFSYLFGSSPQELIRQNHNEIIQWVKKPQDVTLPQAITEGWPKTPHATLYVEGDLVRPQPAPSLPVGITYAPLFSEDGRLINIITTVRDITRFRQAEESKTAFISVISHELKTPVALIKGYAGTLRRDDAKWERSVIEDSLKVIEEEADRLSGYIENLLDATRLQANGFGLTKNDIQLAETLSRVTQRMQTQTKKQKLILEIPAALPVIVADEIRLNQVLTNLISNAIKYSSEGDIIITATHDGNSIQVSVSDHGPGIHQSDAPFVFDRFYRAPDVSRNSKGAGLGLYLAKAIIEAHGGKIWIDPEYKNGAKICFSLPITS